MMSGIEFERFLKLLFEKMGYSAEVTQQSNDQGVDIIVNNNDIKIAIQAKNYSDTVGKAAVQQVYTGMAYYKCNKSIVVTNNYFSESAKDLAKSLNVELWDRDVLEIKLSNLKIIKSKIII